MFDGFRRAVVGIDGTGESFAALEQARRMLAENGALTAVTVCEERLAIHAGFDAPRIAAGIHDTAVAARARAAEKLGTVACAGTRLMHGKPMQGLLAAAEQARADLLAVGSHEHSRASGIVLGSVASEILHYAPESVLVARRPQRPRTGSIVVGVDGSLASLGALAVASRLAAREEACLAAIVAEGGKGVGSAELEEVPGLEWRPGHPFDVLVAAAEHAELIVLGSRGLHGLAALGSVSERVAHRVGCSVLIVRGAAVTRALTQQPAREMAIRA